MALIGAFCTPFVALWLASMADYSVIATGVVSRDGTYLTLPKPAQAFVASLPPPAARPLGVPAQW